MTAIEQAIHSHKQRTELSPSTDARLIDEALMRLVEIFIALPFIVGALILDSMLVPIFGRSIWPAVIALVVFGWTGYARLLRGDILSNKEREYVTASRASGASDAHLVFRHVLTNAIYPTMVYLSLARM